MRDEERALVAAIIGQRIRQARTKMNISQGEISNGIVGQAMISMFENGKKLPTPETLSSIADQTNDPLLHEYAKSLQGKNPYEEIIELDKTSLFEGLLLLDEPWESGHSEMALTEAVRFYDMRQFESASKWLNLIIKKSRRGPTYSLAMFYYGSLLIHQGQFRDAEVWLKEADETRNILDPKIQAILRYNMAYLYVQTNQYALAVWYGKQSSEQFLEQSNFQNYARCLALTGAVASRVGQLDAAKADLEKAYSIFQKWNDGNSSELARAALSLSDVYESEGDLDQARQWSEKAIAVARPIEDYVTLSSAYGILSRVDKILGDSATALTHLKDSLQFASMSDNDWALTWAQIMHVGLLETPADQLEAATIAYETTKQTPESDVQHALACEMLAKLHKDKESLTEAMYYMERAVESYRKTLEGFMMVTPITKHLPLLKN